MEKLKVGIAGYGIVGVRRHKFIDENPHLEVKAICDIRFKSEEPISGVICHHDFNKLIEEDLDVLFVCLPNDVAPTATISGLEKGLHVFCEKPPGKTVQDIRDVMAVEEKNPHLKLKYGFNHRYHDSVIETLNIIKSQRFGKVINIRGVYGKSAFTSWPRPEPGDPSVWRTNLNVAGGGILLDQGIHMVDLIRCMAGDIKEVKSYVSNNYWSYDVEDNAFALMKTEDDAVVFLHSTATQWRHQFLLEVFMEQGACILSGILSGSKSYGQETLTILYREDDDAGNPREQTTTYIKDNSWKLEIEEFADSVINDRPISEGRSIDALKSMELVFDIYNSDEKWKKHMEEKL